MPPRPIEAAPAGWYFNFPVGPTTQGAPAVHYLVRPGSAMRGHISATYRIDMSGGAAFQFIIGPGNTCGGSANFSLYFQRRGDDWQGRGDMQYFRWFSVDAAELMAGERTFAVPLEPAKWTSVFGGRGDTAPAQFAAAIADPMAVGLTFGGGCFKGHGANIDKGAAVFSLSAFVME